MDHLSHSKKVLVAPLDWGLGHATRCIPIINELLLAGCTVVIAGSGKVKALLEAEFPQLQFLHLRGYDMKYAARKWQMPIKLLMQIPQLLKSIHQEQIWLQDVVKKEGINIVISDNRYGLYHSEIKSVFITHQLKIKAPVKSVENFIQSVNYRYINKYKQCWIPDVASTNNLAGELSHTHKKLNIPVYYIGCLSRFSRQRNNHDDNVLIILSGPEPQRTLLENDLVNELKNYIKPVVLVRGLPLEESHSLRVSKNVHVFNHLPAKELELKLNAACYVVARCGYSTIMDLAVLGKKGILIPTPGQTEQEYLAAYLMNKKFALCIEQKRFRLKAALNLASSFPYEVPHIPDGYLKDAIKSLLIQ